MHIFSQPSVPDLCIYVYIYSVCKISNDGLCCSFLQGALPSFGLNQNFVVGLHWGGGEYCFQRCFINTCWGNNHFAQSWDLNGELLTGQSENIAVVPVWSRLDHKSWFDEFLLKAKVHTNKTFTVQIPPFPPVSHLPPLGGSIYLRQVFALTSGVDPCSILKGLGHVWCPPCCLLGD